MPHDYEALREQLRDDRDDRDGYEDYEDYEDAADDDDREEEGGDAVQRFAWQLRAQLLRWDPRSASSSSTRPMAAAASLQQQRAFAAALTEIAALPLDALGMEARRLLVDSDGDAAARVVVALSCRDVRLKCKAASALGSLCVSRVAGQRLLELHGSAALRALARMATSRNRWAQADAVSVLGWVVVIADDAVLAQVARLLPTVVKLLLASARAEAEEEVKEGEGDEREEEEDAERRRRRGRSAAATEDASNLRVYALVLLLNFLQRDASVFAGGALPPLLDAVLAVVHRLNGAAAAASMSSLSSAASSPANERMDAAEFVEVTRLTVTLLGLLLDQHAAASALVLEMKALPALLRLTKTLRVARDAGLLGDGGVDGLAVIDGADGAGDLEARLAAIVDAVLSSR